MRILIKQASIIIEVSPATTNHVTNCIWLNCAICTSHISANKILLRRKYFTMNEGNHLERCVNTNNLLVLVIYTWNYSTEKLIECLYTLHSIYVCEKKVSGYIYSEYERKIEINSKQQLDKKLFCLQNYTFVTISNFSARFTEANVKQSQSDL